MVEYKRAKLRDEEAPETPAEDRVTQDSLEVGKRLPLFSSGLTPGLTPAHHNYVLSRLFWWVISPGFHSISGLCSRTRVRRFKAMTLHKTGSPASLLLNPEVNPTSYLNVP